MTRSDAQLYSFLPGPTPPTIIGGDGVYLHCEDGSSILDAGGGAIVANIGHGRPEIAETARQVLTGGAYTVPLWATRARLQLTERLRSNWLPPELTQVLFTCGGSESVEAALRVARQYQVARGQSGRWKVLGRDISYHGATLGTLSVGNHDRRRQDLDPLLVPLPKIDSMDADNVAKLVEAEDPATIAAIMVEPVSGASGGALVPPDDYLGRLRSLCDDHGILLICDEVMTGFGRTGTRFGVEHSGIVPDILVAGKGLGGGYAPAGGVFASLEVTAPIAEAGGTVMYYTFSGADIVCAVADRVLQIIEEEDLVNRAAVMGAKLNQMLHDAFDDHPHVADVRGRGLLQGLELVADRDTKESFDGKLAVEVVTEALNRGCWIYPAGSGPVPDALLFGPAFVVTDSELEQMVDICAQSIDAAVKKL